MSTPARTGAALAQETMPSTSPVVLVVDDEPAIRSLVRTNLEHIGLQVVEAENGVDGLQAVETQHPDLIILDVMMPLLDGFEVLKRLRSDPATHHLPVIMLTAKSRDVDVFRGWQTGADSYLTKPFSPLELIALVRRVLAMNDSRDAA